MVAFIFRCLIRKKLVGSDKSLESDSEIEPNVGTIMIVTKFKKISNQTRFYGFKNQDFVQEKMATNQAPAMVLAREVLLAGGKRYRPVLTLLAFECAGGKDTSKVIEVAVVDAIDIAVSKKRSLFLG